MRTREILLTELEIAAIREMAIEHWQTVSKHIVAKGKDNISPYAWKLHHAIEALRHIGEPSH